MKSTIPSYKYLYFLVIGIWVIYAALTLLAPVSPASARFHLSSPVVELIRLTILLPMLATWLLALYGAIRFKSYSISINESADGKALSHIANGLGWFVAYLILLTVAGAILTYLRESAYLNVAVSIRNIAIMLAALIGFIYIFLGSLGLGRLINAKTLWTTKRIFLLLAPYCLFAMAFTYAFFINPDLSSPSGAIPTYVLPPPILLVVIVLPYLFMWLLGILSILNLRNYNKTVSGVIYRQALSRLVHGLIGVVALSITFQLLNVLIGTISKFTLGSILILVYALILLIAASYGSIASGARKLARIEANS